MASQDTQSAAPVHRFILLTDIVQSSRLAEQYPSQYESALGQHNQLVEQAVSERGGEVYKQTGDGYLVLFETAGACLDAALALGEALGQLEPLTEDEPLLVRLALHAGELKPSGEEYFGPALNRVSRICQVCNPGQVLLSDAVKTTLPKALDGFELRDLGQHHLRDLAEPEQLYQLDSERFSRHEFPPLSTLDNRPNNLVRQPNHFIGREQELKELAGLLLDDTYLLSIVAPGGYGKSRLAAQLCANLLHRFERGVFMVYLAPVRESMDVPTAIANALGFKFSGSREPEDQLCDYLREKELLLCLDNFEHILERAPLVRKFLDAAPKLKIVTTSREPLRLQGENICWLEPLAVSAEDDGQFSEAQALFADRAALVSKSFVLTGDSATQVQQICQQLNGIPLAIELAAAWADTFALGELSEELSQQLELEARTSDRPERHQSLKASLDWSWNLLGEEQQETLMRLSTFRGGFFSEAASEVLGIKGMKLRSALGRLSDKSWLFSRETNGQARFFLRDMLAHEYSFAKLQEGELYEPAVMAHAAYFSALMAREGPRLYGDGTPTGQLEALATIRLEQQNIDEAIDTLFKRMHDGRIDTASLLLPISRSFWKFLDMIAAYQELVERYRSLKQVAEQAEDLRQIFLFALLGCGQGLMKLGDYKAARSDYMRASLIAKTIGDRYGIAMSLNKLGNVECSQSNFDTARDLHSESLAISREVGDRYGIAASLSSLGTMESDQGNYDAARELHAEALAILREIGDSAGIAASLNNLAIVEHIQGSYSDARMLFAESLAFWREIGDRYHVAAALSNMGFAEAIQGNYDAARELHTESLGIVQEIGDRYGIALSLSNLGIVERSQGNFDAARELYAESLAIRREIGDRNGIAVSLEGLGVVESVQGNYSAASELYAESLAIMREIGNRSGIASCLGNQGMVKHIQGNYEAARELFAESLIIKHEMGDRAGEAHSLYGLALVHHALEDNTHAVERQSQALTIRRELGDLSAICTSLFACASLLAACDLQPQSAVCLSGALHHAEQLDYRFDPMERGLLERASARIEHLETGLPAAERDELKAQAQAMSLDELAEFALAELAKLKDVLQKTEADQQAGA